MRRYPFVQLDVFTAVPLEGNPLAVFPDGRGLADKEMQALAREMNLSETTFILPRDAAIEQQRGVEVRIFTPEEELPFAGHPTLGTGYFLHLLRNQPEILLDLRAGAIPVSFRKDADGRIFGEMRQLDPEFGSTHPAEAIARLAGLDPADMDTSLPIQTVSTGVAFAIAPVRSLKALQKIRLDWPRAEDYAAKTDAKFIFFVSRETSDPAARVQARMIFYNGEDPATGSASGCAAAWMVRYGLAQPEESVRIDQGLEINRRSLIHVRAGRDGDRVVNVRVGGNVVEILRGEVTL
ncbi:MAG: PhzF family phenazine biosynthesis protein [Terriglobales bacterium]